MVENAVGLIGDLYAKKRLLSKNQLKVIAAFFMVIDHVGELFFPDIIILRILGRISFPIFAYSVFESCVYTHRRVLYLVRMLGLGLVCVAAYYIFAGEIFGNILITLSLSVISNRKMHP